MCTAALLQSCPALYDPIDCSLPSSSVHEILQARILEWVARSPGDLPNPNSKHESESRSVVSHSLQPHGLYSPWNSPGQNTGVGSLSLLQRIFTTQGSNPGLPHCKSALCLLHWQVASLPLVPTGKPRNWEYKDQLANVKKHTVSEKMLHFFSCLCFTMWRVNWTHKLSLYSIPKSLKRYEHLRKRKFPGISQESLNLENKPYISRAPQKSSFFLKNYLQWIAKETNEPLFVSIF